ncbi:MAG: hypothetical protein WA900_17070, partial [Casimicrobiaceae bacterium]
ARHAMAQAGADAMRAAIGRSKQPGDIAYARTLLGHYERLIHRHAADAAKRAEFESIDADERRLRRAALAAERGELHVLRDTGVINDLTLRTIEAEIDHAESLLTPEGSAIP